MISHVFKFMDKYHMVEKGDVVAIGVSGGADSLCLLEILMKYKEKVEFTPVVVHVNHMLRAEAYEEAEYVRKICNNQDVDFYLKEISVKKLAREKRISEEEAGRMARYEAFHEVLSYYNEEERKKKIAVAHHQSDVAETLMFHLFRGTGINGMAGIMPCRDHIIRPLLSVSRKRIEEYLKQEGIPWCTDATNEKDIYTRNKIRHHILPYAEREINKESISHVASAALQMAELRDYLEEEVKKAAAICCKLLPAPEEFSGQTVLLFSDKIKLYHGFMQKQIILWCIGQVILGRKDVGAVHIEAVAGLLEKEGNGKLNLPSGLLVQKEYNTISFGRTEKSHSPMQAKHDSINQISGTILLTGETGGQIGFDEKKYHEKCNENYQENDCGEKNCNKKMYYELGNNDAIMEIKLISKKDFKGIEEKKYTKFIDYDKINNCLALRFRQCGDYLTINDKGQRKKLKDYFINEKIPPSLRDCIPLLADGSHIIWAVGYRISAYYKVSDETERILQLTIRRKE